jgi:formate dehydrogenase major subunit
MNSAMLEAPARGGGKSIALEIDGVPVAVLAGTSVMRAAVLAGVTIPKLCADDALAPFGSCRLCLVEIEGHRGFPASCTTPAEEGMKVRTQSERLTKLRRSVLELLLSDHPRDCLICSTSGDCELQAVAASVGLRAVRYGESGASPRRGAVDESNPYVVFDPAKCILCSRCVRACGEVQGSFALCLDGRGFSSKVSPGPGERLGGSECVSCGACVATCPTGALMEKTRSNRGLPDRAVVTTCAYCGVGCTFEVEARGQELVRMVPWKQGAANEGHACVKGRFAWTWVTHPDRMTRPMIRETTRHAWREVSWDEAIGYAAAQLRRIQERHGRGAVGALVSSRCTNEEDYLVQKLVRGAFGNNNVDTCARVCHAPTGYGLGQTLGTSAGTQTFESVDEADVILLIGANPTDAHPVFGSRLKRRARAGAKLIVVDPRTIDLVRSPHVRADFHLKVRPGTNVALLSAMAHVLAAEGLIDERFAAERCEPRAFEDWRAFALRAENSPEATEAITGVPAAQVRGAARLYARGPNSAIYYGLGVTEHSQGSTAVIAIANLAMATGNVGREGVGVNPLRGQNNVQGSCDMGSFPHELPGYRHVSDPATRAVFEEAWGVVLDPEPGLRIPNMVQAALDGRFKGLYCQGEDPAQSEPNTPRVAQALAAMECVVVQDLFLSETAKHAHVFLPGSSFLEKDGTFTNAERRISRVRRVLSPRSGKADWEITMALANALGFPMSYGHPSQIMDEIARLSPAFSGVSYEKLERLGSIQWPCNAAAPEGTPTLHVGGFARGKGRFIPTPYLAADERATARFPLLLMTGRTLAQYNVGTQTRRTENIALFGEDRLEIHPSDASERNIFEGDWVGISSRTGEIALRARLSERLQPGVLFATFHFPESGTNRITTNNADWATQCPEYKLTAVQVSKMKEQPDWQAEHRRWAEEQHRLLPAPGRDAGEVAE